MRACISDTKRMFKCARVYKCDCVCICLGNGEHFKELIMCSLFTFYVFLNISTIGIYNFRCVELYYFKLYITICFVLIF